MLTLLKSGLYIMSTSGHWHQFRGEGIPVWGAVKMETIHCKQLNCVTAHL